MTRTVYHVVIQLTLIFVVIRADQGNSSSGDDSGASGGRSYNVGDFAQVTYIPAEDLQDQLLNTADIAPDMLIAVASSYSALDDDSIGVGGTTSPNTTVLASILIVPSFANDSTSVFESTGNQSEPTPRGELSGRTQLMYNCTSATDLWNLLEDPNVVKLEDFQQFQSNTSNTVGSSSGSSANASAPREIIAVAVVQIENCSEIERSSRGRPVVLNSFFGTTFQNSTPTYLYTNSSVVLGNASGSAFLQLVYSSGDCSDPTNPSSDCCRITCENCFVNMSITSFYADVDVYVSEYFTASEMKLAGNSAIKFKVVSPQGCKVTSKTFVSWGFSPVVVPLGATGFFFKVSFSVDLTGEIYVKPHGTSVEFGATIQVIRLTAGSVNFDDFVDKQIVFQGGEDIRKNGVDIIAELSLGPTLE
ncbi:hypothetical protein F443_23186, partial [Phytophthora nicotianae P1569]